MPRPLLPPEGYARISADVMFNKGLSPVVRDTYASLRLLAWSGDETPELSWEQIVRFTGKERPTVYRHMTTLVNTGVIHWRAAGAGTIVLTFTDGLSQNREMPISSLKTEIQTPPEKKKPARLKNETTPVTLTKEIQAEYERLLGYPVDDWAQGESAAAKKIGQKYTLSQFRDCYQKLKAEPFWASKRLRLRFLVGEMGELLTGKANGKAAHSAGPWRRASQ